MCVHLYLYICMHIYIYIYIYIVMGPLPTHSWTLPNSILIKSQVLSKLLNTLPIFDWQVSLAYATTFLPILLLQYIFKLIPCSELSFHCPYLSPHHIYIYIYVVSYIYIYIIYIYIAICSFSQLNCVLMLFH